LASRQGLKFKIFDAFRPQKAQEFLWSVCPNPTYVANPDKGSNHTRGIAVDLTLLDLYGEELDMGTPFDDFSDQSHHGAILSQDQERNRYTLLGIMMSAGWDFYIKEWWHYQLFNSSTYPLILNSYGMMTSD
jgi:D-alanyl-D-alanine dipeptidase